MSDHFSGPRALAGPLCDIADVYAFPSPERPGQLVIVMNVLPKATASSFFSDAIICRMRVRSASKAAVGPAARFDVGQEETVIDCTFQEPTTSQEGTCVCSSGRSVSFRVHDPEGGQTAGLRVFAGIRSDPFFLDFEAFKESLKTGRLAFRNPGVLFIPGSDVLSIVVEVDTSTLARDKEGSLFAVACETVSAGKLPIRLERVGRPEVKNVLLFARNGDPVNRNIDLRDLYNLEDPFHVGPDYRNAYRSRISANLNYLDSLDGKTGWSLDEQGAHPLTELFMADFLVVDAAKPFAEDTFLEIEQAMLAGRDHVSCGGRAINDDVMDTLYTLLIGGADSPRISDHVDQSTKRAPRTFPYLASPNLLAAPSKPAAAPGPSHVEAKAHHHHHQFGKYQL
jgi:hypothetical protein